MKCLWLFFILQQLSYYVSGEQGINMSHLGASPSFSLTLSPLTRKVESILDVEFFHFHIPFPSDRHVIDWPLINNLTAEDNLPSCHHKNPNAKLSN